MDIGLDFDDGDFESKDRSRGKPPILYQTKVCKRLWFEEETDHADPDGHVQCLKFSGDYHYYHGDFETAITKYQELLVLLPANNQPMRHDVEESLCRCFMKLKYHSKSLEIAHKLAQMMETADDARHRQSLMLLSQVCRDAEDWPGCVYALEQLIHGQSNCSQFWLQLARAYRHSPGEKSYCSEFHLHIVTCYLRAKLLLESVLRTVGQLTRQRNEDLIIQIDKELAELGAAQELIYQASEVIRAEIGHQDEDSKIDDNNIEKNAPFDPKAFYDKWFSWTSQLSV